MEEAQIRLKEELVQARNGTLVQQLKKEIKASAPCPSRPAQDAPTHRQCRKGARGAKSTVAHCVRVCVCLACTQTLEASNAELKSVRNELMVKYNDLVAKNHELANSSTQAWTAWRDITSVVSSSCHQQCYRDCVHNSVHAARWHL